VALLSLMVNVASVSVLPKHQCGNLGRCVLILACDQPRQPRYSGRTEDRRKSIRANELQTRIADPSALPKARTRAYTCIVPTTRSQQLLTRCYWDAEDGTGGASAKRVFVYAIACRSAISNRCEISTWNIFLSAVVLELSWKSLVQKAQTKQRVGQRTGSET
jgi:hypothetical protein